jgi:quercetin dioxygenase-like cupin family protein
MRPMYWGAIVLASFAVGATVGAAVGTNDSAARVEMKRADLSGAPGMEVIASISEYKKGDIVPRHFHHVVETGYVLQGSTVRLPGKEPTMLKTGDPILNLRDAVHAGFTVVGDQPLKLFTVHIVDKGKPLYDWVK